MGYESTKIKIGHRTDDLKSNISAANLYLVCSVAIVLFLIGNEMGAFHLMPLAIRLTAGSVVVMGAIVQVIGRVKSIASRRETKYIIVLTTILCTIIGTTTLNFYAVMMIAFPMLVALHYHSRTVNVLTVTGTVLCALFAPLASYLLGFWNRDYFAWLMKCMDPTILDGSRAAELYNYTAPENGLGILLFVCMPQLAFVILYSVFVISSNKRKIRQYELQLDQLEQMQENILYSMSDIVENRDSNTGGHIRRTSDVIAILMASLQKTRGEEWNISDEYVDAVVKAAPMHDLGKIAIEDKILKKPGRLTKDEFEYIKEHPSKSSETISKILTGIDDELFLAVAKNIAKYHHEKYNGTGYPEGLSGEDIPLEARVMAIADVYDALVSERCYKEAISHEEAYKIIEGLMGTHFDPKLFICFKDSYPKLKEYYESN